MLYVLDTDTCIFCQQERPPEVNQRIEEVGLDAVYLSVITSYELR